MFPNNDKLLDLAAMRVFYAAKTKLSNCILKNIAIIRNPEVSYLISIKKLQLLVNMITFINPYSLRF